MIRNLLCCLACLSLIGAVRADNRTTIAVWPDKIPGASKDIGEEKDITTDKDGKVAGKRLIRLTNVAKPTLTIYPAPKDKATGAAVVVCPGGAYRILAMDLEGTEVCEWLNTLGVTAILLKYRVPSTDRIAPLQDAQRAVSTARSKAKEWGIDPNKIGILGFSAGGNLAARTALGWEKRSYDASDKIDEASCKPNFAVLVYSAYLVNKEKDSLLDTVKVTKQSPSMFLAHAKNDPVPYQNSELLHKALEKAGVASELRLYETGGHGYGLRKTKEECTTWNERCAEWLTKQGWLKK